MSTLFSCSSGHVLSAAPAYAGKRVFCPMCKEVLTVPGSGEPPPPVAILVGPPPDAPHQQSVPAAAPPSLPVADLPVAELVESAKHVADESASAAIPVARLVETPDDEESGIYAVTAEAPLTRAEAASSTPLPRSKRERRESKRLIDSAAAGELKQRLRNISLGLRLHYVKYLCLVLSIFLTVTATALGAVNETLGAILRILSVIGAVAAPLLGVVGSAHCNTPIIPAGSRTLIITSLCLDVTSLVIAVFGGAMLLFSPLAALILLGISGLLNVSAFTLFMLFLRQMASYLGDETLADRCRNTMIAFLCVAVAGPVVIVILLVVLLIFLPWLGVLLAMSVDFIWIVLLSKTLFEILAVIASVRERLQKRQL